VSAIARLVRFFRTGYPEAAPPTGYVPAVALLPRRLTDDEVSQVADDVADRGDVRINGIDIGTAIIRITHELPATEDIDRVKQRLEASK
jgi:hypothetical protein